MTDADVGWEEYLAGHRMAVDSEFNERIGESTLNRQQWGLVMTAIEFRVVEPEDPDRARLVADTSKLDHVLPAMQERSAGGGASMMGGAGSQGSAAGGDPPGGEDSRSGPGTSASTDAGAGEDGDSGGFISRIKDAVVGSGGDDGEALKREAEVLAEEYVDRLQTRLEDRDQWEEIRTLASERGESNAS